MCFCIFLDFFLNNRKNKSTFCIHEILWFACQFQIVQFHSHFVTHHHLLDFGAHLLGWTSKNGSIFFYCKYRKFSMKHCVLTCLQDGLSVHPSTIMPNRPKPLKMVKDKVVADWSTTDTSICLPGLVHINIFNDKAKLIWLF